MKKLDKAGLASLLSTMLFGDATDDESVKILLKTESLNNAYASPAGLYKTGNTLYISGTGGKRLDG